MLFADKSPLWTTLFCAFLDLVGCWVEFVGADGPHVAEGIFELAVPIAPEGVGDWHIDRCTCLDCPIEECVDIFDVAMEHDGRTL